MWVWNLNHCVSKAVAKNSFKFCCLSAITFDLWCNFSPFFFFRSWATSFWYLTQEQGCSLYEFQELWYCWQSSFEGPPLWHQLSSCHWKKEEVCEWGHWVPQHWSQHWTLPTSHCCTAGTRILLKHKPWCKKHWEQLSENTRGVQKTEWKLG